jgi:AhpD family alkylhydroperoxidase
MKLRNPLSITLGLAVGLCFSYIYYQRSQVRTLPPNRRTFPKRIFNLADFRCSMRDFLAYRFELKRARQSGRIDKSFAERLMLATSVVNGCRACCYIHSQLALRAGVSTEEISKFRVGDWEGTPPEELLGLLFAQHFAESGGIPTSEACCRLTEAYGEAKARDLMAFVRFAQLTNLFVNTVEALWSRLLGVPAPRSAWWQEGSVLLLGIILFPATMLHNRWKMPKPGAAVSRKTKGDNPGNNR